MDYKQLEEENKMLRAKLEHIKITKANYFQTVHKHKTFYCKYCDKEIKYNSMWYHNNSKKHLENKGIKDLENDLQINHDLDNYYEDNIN